MTTRRIWRSRERWWPIIWIIFQERGLTQTEFLDYIASKYKWTHGEAYLATEFMFRPKENYN